MPDLRRDAQQRARRHDGDAAAGLHAQLDIGHREREAHVPVRPHLAVQEAVGSELKTCEVNVSPIAGGKEVHRKTG
jgi:hypothetical protein